MKFISFVFYLKIRKTTISLVQLLILSLHQIEPVADAQIEPVADAQIEPVADAQLHFCENSLQYHNKNNDILQIYNITDELTFS